MIVSMIVLNAIITIKCAVGFLFFFFFFMKDLSISSKNYQRWLIDMNTQVHLIKTNLDL